MFAPTDLAAPPLEAPGAPDTLLFLVADTGGGHRRAAEAVSEAMELRLPGRFVTVTYDPLAGPGSSRLLRRVVGLYGPLIRRAPRAWGVIYRLSNSAWAMRVLRRALVAEAAGPIADAVGRHTPSAIVSFHPLTGAAAVEARRRARLHTPVMTVVTDLVTAHRAWLEPGVDRITVPSAVLRSRCRLDGPPPNRWAVTGVPVSPRWYGPPLPAAERLALRRSLGVTSRRFLVLVAGGAEGAGGMAGKVGTILRRFDDIDVVAVCGRNEPLRRRLNRLALHANGRLTATGYVDNLSDWMRCADLVVTKAGPGSIAEAACCGAPLLLTSHLPGQEAGNVELVVGAGAGRYAPTIKRLLREIDDLSHDPAALEAMRAAAVRLSRPRAAADIADLVAGSQALGAHDESRSPQRDAVEQGSGQR
jgi:1,2-diacylglycerol 3-beta-galactosyltransferase